MDENENEQKNAEMEALEAKFREEMTNGAGKQIEEKLQEAYNAFDAAIKLADANGIPVSTRLSWNSDTYVPWSYEKTWGEVDQNVVEELTDVSSYQLESWGWENSYC